ncbi:uncharacterized protein [Argopecten irradians]|uniref:uncharacterized protein n=1 Tax=Argopecten irradians TaxID=31199 RepID=UPI0037137D6E
MAFSTTYHSILNNNLKCIYGSNCDTRITRSPSKLPFVSPKPRKCPETSMRKDRSLKYDEEHRVFVHRAPAFEVLSKECIKDMVNRMHRPKTRHGFTSDTKSESSTSTLTINRSLMSLSDIKSSSDRLCNQHTVSTEVRKSLTESLKLKTDTPSIKSSCPRMTMSISQRYYPRSYKNWYSSKSS